MRIAELKIQNFRGLEDISLSGMEEATAITVAGPNAVGKSTVLEAIRLLKVILAPTYGQETAEALRDMGVMVANQLNLEISSLIRNPQVPLKVAASFVLDEEEVTYLKAMLPQWSRQRLAGRLGINSEEINTKLIQFLSSSDGQQNLQQAQNNIEEYLNDLSSHRCIKPSLIIDPTSGSINGSSLNDQEVLAILSQRNSGYSGLFNYFPADRAMPGGEVPIQLGSHDFSQQIKSHIALPATKYSRLKHYLVSRSLLGDEGRKELLEDFRSVFEELLYDKVLEALNLSQTGRLQVLIKEISSGAIYDIDRMSSGEKGLLLTVFLMKRTTSPKGLILLDEPELHLNTSVCKMLLPFLIRNVLEPLGTQAIICTHSEEVLASAFENDDCQLFHLRNSKDISRIEIQDREEMSEALKALGTSNIDVLFSNGTLYVEGQDDEIILRSGFSERVKGFKIISLGGRNEVEKQIQALQSTEKKGHLDSNHGFIFDNDRKITSLESTELVHILQWDRYCLENYLLDGDAIYDAIKNINKNNEEFSRGIINSSLEKFALTQIPFEVCRLVYSKLEPDNPGLRFKEHKDLDDYEESANILASRLTKIRDQLQNFNQVNWTNNFIQECQNRDKLIHTKWTSHWIKLCNGKEVLMGLHRHYGLRKSPADFKKEIIIQMKNRNSEGWKLIDHTLENTLKF